MCRTRQSAVCPPIKGERGRNAGYPKAAAPQARNRTTVAARPVSIIAPSWPPPRVRGQPADHSKRELPRQRECLPEARVRSQPPEAKGKEAKSPIQGLWFEGPGSPPPWGKTLPSLCWLGKAKTHAAGCLSLLFVASSRRHKYNVFVSG